MPALALPDLFTTLPLTIMYRIVALILMLSPVVTLAHPGGIDARGGHYCRTDCEARGYYTDRYHYHPEKMDDKQLKQYETFKDRLCSRVVKRFSDDDKMWKRVNDRVEKRFGFACEKQ